MIKSDAKILELLAPAKLNLFLHIVGRRSDGYHLLQSVFQLIDWCDLLTLKLIPENEVRRINPIPGVTAENDLVVRAATLLKDFSGNQLGVEISLKKEIPMGAGLGGGSSDAASTLIGLNTLWNLNLDQATLSRLGLKLGADVPFFIFGKNAWVEGVGEKIQEIPLPANHYLVLTPKIHVSTAQIFNAKELTRNTFPTTIAAFSEMQDFLHNDLEAVVCQQYPAVKACLDWLNQYSKARMSGSGASVFIAQKTEVEVNNILRTLPKRIANTKLFCASSLGLNQHPLYNLTSEQ